MRYSAFSALFFGSILFASSVSAQTYMCEFSTNLERRSNGAAVAQLQKFLASDPTLYPEADITGFYGASTELAVMRFQILHGIVESGTPDTTGFGVVGPVTRSVLSEQCTIAYPLQPSTSPVYEPDLRITSTRLIPNIPLTGKLASFKAKGLNNGIVASNEANAILKIDEKNDGTVDTAISKRIKPLRVNEEFILQWLFAWTFIPGVHSYEICLDNTNVITETNEVNNCETKLFWLDENSKSEIDKFDTTLVRGMEGDAVKKLQKYLVAEGYLVESAVTGVYENKTRAAVNKFQEEYSGVIGRRDPNGSWDNNTYGVANDLLGFGDDISVEAGAKDREDAKSEPEATVLSFAYDKDALEVDTSSVELENNGESVSGIVLTNLDNSNDITIRKIAILWQDAPRGTLVHEMSIDGNLVWKGSRGSGQSLDIDDITILKTGETRLIDEIKFSKSMVESTLKLNFIMSDGSKNLVYVALPESLTYGVIRRSLANLVGGIKSLFAGLNSILRS
jgi:peptidoglycan hydrolase-like protein with peptidoglycan-binding domain